MFNGHGVSVWDDENVLKMDSGKLYHTCLLTIKNQIIKCAGNMNRHFTVEQFRFRRRG